MEELVWCFSLKNGLRLTEESDEEAESYEKEALETLKDAANEKGMWKIVKAYYACYFAAYSILRVVGLKSENHYCTFRALRFVFKELGINPRTISFCERLKEKRVEAQYYLKKASVDLDKVKEVVMELLRVKKEVKLKKNEIRKDFEEIVKGLAEKEL